MKLIIMVTKKTGDSPSFFDTLPLSHLIFIKHLNKIIMQIRVLLFSILFCAGGTALRNLTLIPVHQMDDCGLSAGTLNIEFGTHRHNYIFVGAVFVGLFLVLL